MSTEQSITIKIAGVQYPLKASSPELEQKMRNAADDINRKLAAYDAKYPNKSKSDKLAFVALNESVTQQTYRKMLDDAQSETKKLQEELETYLKNIGD